ncbi:hypothetical protein BY458DRAFT_560979 [Sporodiniella umbellata]|nr:hypothetical protein BY458DRAFT_560979 [Sporodiniella umbellata]
MTEQSSEGIYTYCIEYAQTQQSKCHNCKAIIPNKSLRAAEIYRKSAKEKKKQAKHTWYHFKCWALPEKLLRIPLDMIKGYSALQEKDKNRVQKLVKNGAGTTWKDVMKKEKADRGEEEEEEEKPKKSKEIEDDVDMTENLTGVQQKKEKKDKSLPKKSDEKPKEKIAKKKDDKSKVTKNKKAAVKEAHKVKEVVLPHQDQNELESIAQEFQALKKSKK